MHRRLWLLAVITASLACMAEGADGHAGGSPETATEATATPIDAAVLRRIADAYEASVRPLLRKSCADCHGTATQMPWYYEIPGVRQLIDWDIAFAREHLDLRNGFPFGGHAGPRKSLEAIAKVVREGSMPPWRYRVVHEDAVLSEAERAVVLAWVRESLERLAAP